MKVTIVGAGNVGSTCAHIIASKDMADVVLVDIKEGLAEGKALDILQCGPVEGFHKSVIGTSSYEETKDSDICIITAGLARKPGMTRDDLLNINKKIVTSVTKELIKYSPNSILIIVSNPLDAMVNVAYKVSGFDKNKVMGMAGILDSARFRTFIAKELKAHPKNVEAMVLGGHGDNMVPLIGHAKVDGVEVKELLSKEKIDEIINRTRMGGIEIVNHLKTGSAYYAPARSIVEMVESIMQDSKKILPVAAYLDGEYGEKGIFMGVPVVLGKEGVIEVKEIDLNLEEKEMFDKTVEHVKELNSKI